MADRSANTRQPDLAPTLAPLLGRGNLSIKAAFERLSKAGFRTVQLSAAQPGLKPRELDKPSRRDLLATLRRNEMAPSGIDAWIPAGDFVDPQKADRAVDAVHGAVELAADLGRVPVSLIMPAEDAVSRSLIDHAQHHGVELADHRVPPADVDGLGVGIDPAAWLARGDDPARGAMMHAGRLVCARLCDLLLSGMRGPIGDPLDGRLDVLAYQVGLSVAGYRRAVVVDARQWSDPWSGLELTRARWTASVV
jgi:sugar phosphate isomerase/epimerase